VEAKVTSFSFFRNGFCASDSRHYSGFLLRELEVNSLIIARSPDYLLAGGGGDYRSAGASDPLCTPLISLQIIRECDLVSIPSSHIQEICRIFK
jgi:hypothetical protein